MRDIIFRGKRISDGEWVEGYLGVEVGGAPVIEYCGTDEDTAQGSLRMISLQCITILNMSVFQKTV